MAIMNCYPDERAIENELGGKWELFFEETRDETGAVGLEWDKDYDETPLHLNGIMIIIDGTTSAISTYAKIDINGVSMFNETISLRRYASFKGKIENGMLNSSWKPAAGAITSLSNVNVSHNMISTLMNSITNFSIVVNSVVAGTKISVYVLRGV